MANQQILENLRLYMGGADYTGYSNKIDLGAEVEEKDGTTFGDYDATTGKLWKVVKGGIASAKVQQSGFWEAGDLSKVDDDSFAALGGLTAWSALPQATPAAATYGDLAWLVKPLRASYMLGGSVGDLAPWSGNLSSAWPLVRGVCLHPPGTARTATGNGTAVQIVGGVPAGQYLYAALHVLSVSGTSTPTVTVKIQSDNASNFPSSTDVMTFTAATARTGEVIRAAGAITDDYYRVNYTISGSSPSFLFIVTIGVR